MWTYQLTAIFVLSFILPVIIRLIKEMREKEKEVYMEATRAMLEKQICELQAQKRFHKIVGENYSQGQSANDASVVTNMLNKVTETNNAIGTNCPNCGAPLNIHGQCEYCSTFVRRAASHEPFSRIELFADGVKISSDRIQIDAIQRSMTVTNF